ncbi:hypothetical protein BDY21DRAFT_312963 [Lineolata rhizophorae]|uniref:FAD/NAD(P)-binding domain-containing protein n=1 Tax=Lineolata rhizophorae TaxID=578093 RepID=A0A6A6PFE4_9PEZI|nr:hypothetical protein BDY21DRAFT_312963 [Lineolata rhizophorae]
MTTEPLDALIIGGGPAGLAAATGLVRQLFTAVVFDSGKYRNDVASHMHSVVGYDHVPPATFRAKGRADILARYQTVRFEDVAVESVRQTDDGLFEAVDASGKEWLGRKVVLAMGVRDILPAIDGFADCWGRRIFHCLFCHGYEERGAASTGVLAVGPVMGNPMMAMHQAHSAKRLAHKVTVYTNGSEELAGQLRPEIAGEPGFSVDTRPISGLAKGPKGSEVVVKFANGDEPQVEGFLVYNPQTEPNGPFVKQLGLELTAMGDIKSTPPFYQSSVPGVFAAGDCGTMFKVVPNAMAMGGFAAGGISFQLHGGDMSQFQH